MTALPESGPSPLDMQRVSKIGWSLSICLGDKSFEAPIGYQ